MCIDTDPFGISLAGGGWAGTQHFIDPTTGIAVVLGTQVVPYGDVELFAGWAKLEELIYSAVDKGL